MTLYYSLTINYASCRINEFHGKGIKMRKALLITSLIALLTVAFWPKTAGLAKSSTDFMATDITKGEQMAKKNQLYRGPRSSGPGRTFALFRHHLPVGNIHPVQQRCIARKRVPYGK